MIQSGDDDARHRLNKLLYNAKNKYLWYSFRNYFSQFILLLMALTYVPLSGIDIVLLSKMIKRLHIKW